MKVSIRYLVLLVTGIYCCLGCNKSKFLEEKQSTDIFVPSTLEDCLLLLDNTVLMSASPALGEVSADNYYIFVNYWQRLTIMEQRAYKWEAKIYNGDETVSDWNVPYRQVFTANVVIDAMDRIAVTDDNEKDWNFKKGWALFARAYAFYNLSQIFSPAYDGSTNNIPNLGIPLRLSPNIDELTQRSTVNETYDQILKDLREASRLLPDVVPVRNLNRASKPAAYALLARVHLSMRDYEKAGLYADSCLGLYSTLMDYNSYSVSKLFPFDKYNIETVYHSQIPSSTMLIALYPDFLVDTNLYRSYDENDLRRTFFFNITAHPNKLPILRPGYTGTVNAFSGFATDEMYLVRAESYARAGKVEEAMNDLNKLLKHRYKTNTFTEFSTTITKEKALELVLVERRKEMPFRGVRWMDLRRLNKDGANITLRRSLNGQPLSLPPNDLRYTLPIPPDVLRFTGIEDNKRE